MRSTVEFLRGLASVLFFVAFGIGALLLSPFALLMPGRGCGHAVVRFFWRLLARLFVMTGLIRLDLDGLGSPAGAVLVANHPSYIDVLLLVALVPRTLYVAKRGLRRNPFMAGIVRATALPDDARLLEAAPPYLARGWNVLVFPEGTRSPACGLHPFRRGAAQLALRTGAPLAAIGIRQSRRILGKRQRAWDLGASRVTYAIRMDAPRPEAVAAGESPHAAACRVTAALRRRVEGLCA